MSNKKQKITGKELGSLLFNIHHHKEDGRIIYLEDDLLPLLKAIGLPEPIWGENMTLEQFLKK